MKNLRQTGRFLFLTVFFTLILSLYLCATIFAEEASSKEPSVIIALENSDYLSNLPAVEIIQNTQGDIEELYWFVFTLTSVNATVQHGDGTTETMALSVAWNCTDYTKERIDPSVLGTYTETGTIQLPGDNYTWGEGVLQTLTVPVHVIVPEKPIVLTSLSPFSAKAFALEQGGELSELLSQVEATLICYEENGKAHVADITWNTEDVDTQTAGAYHLTGQITAPMHCVFSEELQVPALSIPVSVQEAGKPNINCFIIYYDYLMQFPWIMSEDKLDSIQPWLKEGDGEWKLLSLEDDVEYSSDFFGIYLWSLTEGCDYKLQVDYDGGKTCIVSFQYSADGILTMKSAVDGDRDGGDTDGNTNNSSDNTSDQLNTPPNTDASDSNNSGSDTGADSSTQPGNSDSNSSDSDTGSDSSTQPGNSDSNTPGDDNGSDSNTKPDDSDSNTPEDGHESDYNTKPEDSDSNTPGDGNGSDSNTKPDDSDSNTPGDGNESDPNTKPGDSDSNTPGDGNSSDPNTNTDTNNNSQSTSANPCNNNQKSTMARNTASNQQNSNRNQDGDTDSELSADASSAISAIITKQATEEPGSEENNDSEDVTTITGAELLLMLETSDTARFSCNGITLSCSASSLRTLNISSEDILKISIVPDDAGGFTLSITLNGTAITELSGMEIMIPFSATSDSPALSLLDSEGNLVSEGTYDAMGKLAIFTINRTGYFSIQDENATNTAPQSFNIVFVLVILFLGMILVGCFVLHRRLNTGETR